MIYVCIDSMHGVIYVYVDIVKLVIQMYIYVNKYICISIAHVTLFSA